MPAPKLMEKIQQLLNAVLRQDDLALAAISELAGKIIAIQITDTDLTVFVQFEEEGIRLSGADGEKPNVTIRARPFTFIGLLLNREGKGAGITPDMEIRGDTHLAQRFQELLRNMQIDWEEHLSRLTGDIPAHQIGRLFRSTRSWLRETRATLGMNISEYMRYESNILPVREDVADFVSAVDALRDDVERLQQRLERLHRQMT